MFLEIREFYGCVPAALLNSIGYLLESVLSGVRGSLSRSISQKYFFFAEYSLAMAYKSTVQTVPARRVASN